MSQQYPPLLVIIGPTASGKSDLAVDLALRYGGEVISADSRQVYQSLFYTTGKISEEEMRGVPHHMLDVVPPGESYNAHLFVDAASRHIADIYTRGSIPIVAGGTGFYIDTLLFDGSMSNAPSDPSYRRELEHRDRDSLVRELREKDSKAYDRVDTHNPRRVIRALEVIRSFGRFVPQERRERYAHKIVGIKHSRKHVRERIALRLDARFDAMIDEVRNLLDTGIDPDWLDGLGLECRHVSRMFTQGVSKEDTYTNLLRATVAYAKRQETWWRRYSGAMWFQEHEFKDMYRYLDDVYAHV